MASEWMERQSPKNLNLERSWMSFVQGLVDAVGRDENESGGLDGCLNCGKPGRIEVWAGGPYIDFILNEEDEVIEVYRQDGTHPAEFAGKMQLKEVQCNLEDFGLTAWVKSSEAGVIVVNKLNTPKR